MENVASIKISRITGEGPGDVRHRGEQIVTVGGPECDLQQHRWGVTQASERSEGQPGPPAARRREYRAGDAPSAQQREQCEAQVRQDGVGHADFRPCGSSRRPARPARRTAAAPTGRPLSTTFVRIRDKSSQATVTSARQSDRFAQMTVHAQPRDPRGGGRAGAAGSARAHKQQDQGADSQRGREAI